MINTISPKSEFMADEKKAGQFQDLVLSPLFREGAKAALLHYSMSLSKKNTEGPTLAVVGLRMQGAQEVLEVLMNLGRHVAPEIEGADDHLDPI